MIEHLISILAILVFQPTVVMQFNSFLYNRLAEIKALNTGA